MASSESTGMLVSDSGWASAMGAPPLGVTGPAREGRDVPSRRHHHALPRSSQPALLPVLVIACLTAACATAHPAGMSRRNPNVISREEIQQGRQAGVRDLYELIERDRPLWLQTRNPRSLQLPTVIAVYHNQMLLGGVDVLRGYQLTSVTSIRYLDAAQAMVLPGAGSSHFEGAIVISTAVARDTSAVALPDRPLEGGTP